MGKEIQNYIGNQMTPALCAKTLNNWDPATGAVCSRLPDSQKEDVDLAIEKAQSAFLPWSKTPARDRAQCLRNIAGLIEKRQDEFAKAESLDTGKPLRVALQVDIPRSILNFRFFADAITQFSSECYANENTSLHFTLRKPLGVVGCISPWNLPLYLLTWKIAPALASGNTVVAKPSEVTPMTAHLMSTLCLESGLPPGVLNIVHGRGSLVGAHLTRHKDVKAISFTGSSRVGSEIAQTCGPLFKKVSLEMGGKNPTIIFADGDFKKALDGTVKAAFSNQGQICLCGSRILIEKSIYKRFKDALVRKTKELIVGDPLGERTDLGAVVSQAHLDKVCSYIEFAKKEGGHILTGGHRVSLPGRCQNGWFIAPTLIEGLSWDSRTNQEEIFGPVATLIAFDSEEECLKIANSTDYGLSASLWTENLSRAHRLAPQLEAGMIWVNAWMLRDLRTPFGGVKRSGVGREGGMEALKFFTETQNICINISS